MDLKEAVRQNLHVVGPGQKAAIQVCHRTKRMNP